MNNRGHKYNTFEDNLWVYGALIGLIVLLLYLGKDKVFKSVYILTEKFLVAKYHINEFFGITQKHIFAKMNLLEELYSAKTTFGTIWDLIGILGILILPFVLPVLIIWLIVVNYFYKKENYFTRSFDYYSLKKEFYKINPKLNIIKHFKPFATDEEKGIMAKAATPYQYACKHNLINPNLLNISEVKESFNSKRVLQILHKQTGNLFPHPLVVDNEVRLSGGSFVILGILCMYHEHKLIETKELIFETHNWVKVTNRNKISIFKKLFTSKKNYPPPIWEYKLEIPPKKYLQLKEIIIQAFTNSSTISDTDREKRAMKDEPFINNAIRNTLYIHNFNTTVLMSLWSKMPMVSTRDIKWLKAIHPNLYWALNSVGRPSPFVHSMGPFYMYDQEVLLFKKNMQLITKNLNKPINMTSEEALNIIDWENPINYYYFSLDDTQWVHHDKYRDVVDDNIINLEEKEFSYDNIVHIMLIADNEISIENPHLSITRIQFRKDDRSVFLNQMDINRAGKLDTMDAEKLAMVLNSYYIYTNDYNALKKIVRNNRDHLGEVELRGYDVLADACEVYNTKAYSWAYLVQKFTSNDSDNELQNLSGEDMNWILYYEASSFVETSFYNQDEELKKRGGLA